MLAAQIGRRQPGFLSREIGPLDRFLLPLQSFKIAMICSSLNLLRFIRSSFQYVGLYQKLEEI
jgi:hypothetical protein